MAQAATKPKPSRAAYMREYRKRKIFRGLLAWRPVGQRLCFPESKESAGVPGPLKDRTGVS